VVELAVGIVRTLAGEDEDLRSAGLGAVEEKKWNQ